MIHSGPSEVVAVTAICVIIVEIIQQTWWQSSTMTPSRILASALHSMDTHYGRTSALSDGTKTIQALKVTSASDLVVTQRQYTEK